MKCENCGKDNPPDQKFCEDCGNTFSPNESVAKPADPTPTPEALGIECPACKHLNPLGSSFCNYCGSSLQNPTPTAPTTPVDVPATAPVEPVVPMVSKVLVLPDGTELVVETKKTFGRLDFARTATEPMWVSRQHFTIFEEDGVSYIQDDESSNGTKLNGKEIKQAGKQQLKSGDEIVVGDSLKVIFKTK